MRTLRSRSSSARVVPSTQFLASPAAIRQSIVRSISTATALDLAVAFVGEDWWTILESPRVPIRLVCWLTSTNTNPYAVEQLLSRQGVSVRHLHRMHAKVYIAHSDAPTAIVGSANISGAALSSDDVSGQYEAAVTSFERSVVADVTRWFDSIWEAALAVTPSDLDAAKEAWNEAHVGPKSRRFRPDAEGRLDSIPGDWVPPEELVALAAKVAGMDLANGREFGDEWEFVGGMNPEEMTEDDVDQIFRFLVNWAGHPGVFRPFTEQPIESIRHSFSLVFDESVEIGERLIHVAPGAEAKIPGLGLTSWTILLQWRLPALYPPFNRRTHRFLLDFGLAQYAPKAITPVAYSRWCSFARELSARLQLPTPGHVDRVVWEYTKNMEID